MDSYKLFKQLRKKQKDKKKGSKENFLNNRLSRSYNTLATLNNNNNNISIDSNSLINKSQNEICKQNIKSTSIQNFSLNEKIYLDKILQRINDLEKHVKELKTDFQSLIECRNQSSINESIYNSVQNDLEANFGTNSSLTRSTRSLTFSIESESTLNENNESIIASVISEENNVVSDDKNPTPGSVHATNELYNTEKDYINDLWIIINDFKENMKFDDMPKELQDGKDKIVFGNIVDIHEWHKKKFLPDLENCQQNFTDICALFIKHENKFKTLYSRYCKNKPKSEYIINEFQQYFEELRVRAKQTLNLSDFLIKPVQRITKYGLLLLNIQKYLVKEKIEFRNYEGASEITSRIPKNANDMMIVGRIENYDNELPDELILQDNFQVYESEKSFRIKLKFECRKLLLFQDKIVFIQVIGNEQAFTIPRYIFKKEIMVNKLDLKINDDKMFTLIAKDTNKKIICKADTKEKCSLWTKKLQNMLDFQFDFLEFLVNPQAGNF